LAISPSLIAAEKLTTIKINTGKGTQVLEVPTNTEEVYLIKQHDIRNVEGLERLPRLRRVTFDLCSFNAGIEFLAEYQQIKELVITFSHGIKSFGVLGKLPGLEQLILREMELTEIQWNLSNNQSLQYLEVDNSTIADFSFLRHLPKSMKYINLYMNEVEPARYQEVESLETEAIVVLNMKHYLRLGWNRKGFYFQTDPWKIIPKGFYHPSS
jgi:Leucine-rich repeat (LRR) protein